MDTLRCLGCGQQAYLRNDWCSGCRTTLCFSPRQWAFKPLQAAEQEGERPCAHFAAGLCNWLIEPGDANELCVSCRMTQRLPPLGQTEVDQAVYRLELAKRRLLLNLKELGLPVLAHETRQPLRFEFLQDQPGTPAVMTGHANGLITVNIKESDPLLRLNEQLAMGEAQRTLLGHLRHESGHFYWDEWMSEDGECLAGFREHFGDERQDYAQALARHHAEPISWDPLQPNGLISRYASAHPWEDWAETWAHYLLMIDALSEVEKSGRLAGQIVREESFVTLLDEWLRRAQHGNALNRALGLPDAYPFVIDDGVQAKLTFVHEVVRTHPVAQ